MEKALDEDIRAAVDQAIGSRDMLRIPEIAKQLAARHPHSGLSESEIADLLLKAGVDARVPLEWGQREDSRRRPGDEEG